jgi:SAM-dependent methyltransferase
LSNEGGATLKSSVSLTLVVPMFDESARFTDFADALTSFVADYAVGSELVFVDDGSRDTTVQLVRQFIDRQPEGLVRLLEMPHRGKGAAVSSGLASATTSVAAFCDLDLSTPLGELARIVDAAASSSAIAIGSRGTATSRITRHQSPWREAMGRVYNRVVQYSVVPGIADTQCGAKAASTESWQRVLPLCGEPGFAWDVELVACARSLGIPVQEIGIEWSHHDGSRIHPLRDGIGMVRAIPRIRRRLRHAPRTHARGLPAEHGAGSGTFGDDAAAWFLTVDPTHWWLRSKATFVALALRRHSLSDGWLVDIGAGTADVTAMLGWAPTRTLTLEGNSSLAKAITERHAVTPMLGDASHVPLRDGSATVVCLLDVIEHVVEPLDMLREAARILGPDGRMIVNVPAHQWLWSEADVALGHTRRYTVRTLRADLERAGCEVVWASHVFSWLVLPVWLRRKAMGGGEPQLGMDTSSTLIDRSSMVLTRLEWLIAARRPLPLGTSVLCVARRAENKPPQGVGPS